MADVADPAAQRRRCARGVGAEEREATRGRARKQREDAEERRLPGAVRPEQDDRIARAHDEIDAREDGDAREAPTQRLGADRIRTH